MLKRTNGLQSSWLALPVLAFLIAGTGSSTAAESCYRLGSPAMDSSTGCQNFRVFSIGASGLDLYSFETEKFLLRLAKEDICTIPFDAIDCREEAWLIALMADKQDDRQFVRFRRSLLEQKSDVCFCIPDEQVRPGTAAAPGAGTIPLCSVSPCAAELKASSEFDKAPKTLVKDIEREER